MTTGQQRVLVTGASGFIGQQICPFLEGKGVILRAFDRRSHRVVPDVVVGNLEDLSALRKAAEGMDVMIHLAACSDDADFVTRLVPSNVVGVYHALEAVRLEGVRRFILASSCQAADRAAEKHRVTVADRHPTDHYGLTKLWGEEMAEMYSRRYGLSVLAARLGWVVRDERELHEMRKLPHGTRLFLSLGDLREFFHCALIAPPVRFAIVYAFSRQPAGEIFDMEPARHLLGFEPRDTLSDAVLEHDKSRD